MLANADPALNQHLEKCLVFFGHLQKQANKDH